MEWVETTGKTIDEAKEAALDELGVDEQDAEFEILAEPKMGLFGRVRSEGRVRARVRPTTPRAKEDRRDRRRRNRAAAAADGESESAPPKAAATKKTGGRGKGRSSTPAAAAASSDADTDTASAPTEADSSADTDVLAGSTGPRRNRRRRGGRGTGSGVAAAAGPETNSEGADTTASPDGSVEGTPAAAAPAKKAGTRRRRPVETTTTSLRHLDDADNEAATEGADMEVALEEQGGVASEFLHGLVERFGLTAAIDISQPDEDTLNIQLSGGDLGLLIGPKGATLLSIQDLTRTVVQRKTGAGNGRIYVDVSGYRQKRAEALARFTTKVASDVVANQQRIALEPMSAPDRKVVHDTASDIDGVSTLSEGEEPRRRVVIIPAEG
jgi:spoIIIJ-associated protein